MFWAALSSAIKLPPSLAVSGISAGSTVAGRLLGAGSRHQPPDSLHRRVARASRDGRARHGRLLPPGDGRVDLEVSRPLLRALVRRHDDWLRGRRGHLDDRRHGRSILAPAAQLRLGVLRLSHGGLRLLLEHSHRVALLLQFGAHRGERRLDVRHH